MSLKNKKSQKPAQITEELWTLGKQTMVASLFVMHIWGTVLIYKEFKYEGGISSGGASMFSSICNGIFWCLAVLYSGKAADKFLALKWGGEPEKPVQSVQKEQEGQDAGT